MSENMNEVNEIKINALEEKELTLEESEKVAGGTPYASQLRYDPLKTL